MIFLSLSLLQPNRKINSTLVLAALNQLHAGARLCLALADILVGLGGVRVEAVLLAVRFADIVVARAEKAVAFAGHASGEVVCLDVLAALGDLATHEHVDDSGVDHVGADEEGEDSGGYRELHLGLPWDESWNDSL